MADGSIIIETRIDNSGIQRDSRQTQQIAQQTAERLINVFRQAGMNAQNSMQNVSDSVLVLQEALRQTGTLARERLSQGISQSAQRASESIQNIENDLQSVSQQAERTGESLSQNLGGTSAQNITNVSRALQNTQSRTEKLGKAFQSAANVSAAAFAAVQAALIAVGGYALKVGNDYQRAVNQLQTSTGATKAMMDNFGISAEQAYSLMAQGAQNGLDYSGELIDNINEYSVQFAKVGLNAEDMFNIFQSGADSGAWNLDKVG